MVFPCLIASFCHILLLYPGSLFFFLKEKGREGDLLERKHDGAPKGMEGQETIVEVC